MTPIERAARAVHAQGLLLDADECERVARAVLEAVREPSEAMIEAGATVEMRSYCEGDPTADVPDDRGIWQAMIDAALSE